MSEVKRSHPPSLRNTIKKTLAGCDLKPDTHILIGVSGGSDSMALLNVMWGLRDELKFRVTAVGVNHHLRPEAGNELEMVSEYCAKFGIPFIVKNVYLNHGGNIQSRARDARYAVLNEAMEECGANFLATAHHAEDLAETVLMRIIRGTSVGGLNVLQPINGNILRPMIRARKRDVMLHISRKNIPYAEDPSNKNTKKYLRSKMRFEILPELEKINPNVVEALCELAISSARPEVMGKRQDRKKK